MLQKKIPGRDSTEYDYNYNANYVIKTTGNNILYGRVDSFTDSSITYLTTKGLVLLAKADIISVEKDLINIHNYHQVYQFNNLFLALWVPLAGYTSYYYLNKAGENGNLIDEIKATKLPIDITPLQDRCRFEKTVGYISLAAALGLLYNAFHPDVVYADTETSQVVISPERNGISFSLRF